MPDNPNNPYAPKEPVDFEQLSIEAQHISLRNAVHVARAWLEQTAQEHPQPSAEEMSELRQRKAEAAQRLVEFEVAHGLIPQPPEGEGP